MLIIYIYYLNNTFQLVETLVLNYDTRCCCVIIHNGLHIMFISNNITHCILITSWLIVVDSKKQGPSLHGLYYSYTYMGPEKKTTENLFSCKTPLLSIKISGQSNYKQFFTYSLEHQEYFY